MPASPGVQAVVDYLAGVPAWYLATCEGGQPHVRPFGFAALEDGRIWFCASAASEVRRELEANPKFELTAWRPGSGWVVLRGRACGESRPSEAVRQAACDHRALAGEPQGGPGDPALAFFSLADVEAWVCDIDGSWDPLEL